MNRRLLILAVCAASAGWFALSGNKSSMPLVTEAINLPVRDRATRTVNAEETPKALTLKRESGQVTKAIAINAIAPRDELIGGEHSDNATESFFESKDWRRPSLPPPKTVSLPPPVPPPPAAPPLPFTYLGKKFDNAAWEVFLAAEEKVYVVRQATIIDNQYRIDSINPPTMRLTYLPLNQVQTLTIGIPE